MKYFLEYWKLKRQYNTLQLDYENLQEDKEESVPVRKGKKKSLDFELYAQNK